MTTGTTADVTSSEPPSATDAPTTDERVADHRPPKAVRTNRFRALSVAVALVCVAFIFAVLNWPNVRNGQGDFSQPLLFLDTTPSGGDMGAHVWGPAYLRDHLLPQLRLSGWTPDWYAGFPAYQFYMVVPSLLIVAVNAGLPPLIGVPAALAVLFGTFRLTRRLDRSRFWVGAAGVAAAVMLVSVPYGVSFKLVSVSGLLAFPFAAMTMARLCRSETPVPSLVALAGLVFLFDTSPDFSIIGGNIASTLAGEFAFSLSLCISLLVIGLAVRGMDEGRWRAGAAGMLALVALCHIIPVFFVMPALAVTVLVHRDIPRVWPLAATVALAMVPMAFADDRSTLARILVFLVVGIVAVAAAVAEPVAWRRLRWMLFVGPVAIMTTGFWLLPFYYREPYFNDMGWERKTEIGPLLLTTPMKVALPVAAIGVVLSYATRDRVGIIFTATGIVFASAVANVGEGALWNARLLPFYYLSVYVLAAVGVALVIRTVAAVVADDLHHPDEGIIGFGAALALVGALIAVSMPLRTLPFGHVNDANEYEWLMFTNTERSFLPTWINWNYSGYEMKDSYREYADAVNEMSRICDDVGPGRAMWEYNKEQLDAYGTPMALMLLPHWTDGCIGSMEGLYFESSSTTPFHFLNQSMLSDAPSRAQRDLPYESFDITKGVDQLKIMGVRYYMAITDKAIEAADTNPDLTRVGESPPFVIYEVAGSDLVETMPYTPVVVSGPTAEQVAGDEEAGRFDVGWVSQAVEYYNNVDYYRAMPAESGPSDWERHQTLAATDGIEVGSTEVSDIETTTNSISFTVAETGRPMLVKTSYFPNWTVDGAEGPWRVGPNLMAVVPTANEVTLRYVRSPVDWIGLFVTFAGLAALGWFAFADGAFGDRRRRSPRPVDAGAAAPGDGDGPGYRGAEAAPRQESHDQEFYDQEFYDQDELVGAGRRPGDRPPPTPAYSPDLVVDDFLADAPGRPGDGADADNAVGSERDGGDRNDGAVDSDGKEPSRWT